MAKWSAIVAGGILALLAIPALCDAFDVGRIIDHIDLSAPQTLVIHAVDHRTATRDSVEVAASELGKDYVARFTLIGEDGRDRKPGDPLIVFLTHVADPTMVSAEYVKRMQPSLRLPGIPLAGPALTKAAIFLSAGSLLILSAFVIGIAFRPSPPVIWQPPADLSPIAAPADQPSRQKRKLVLLLLLGDSAFAASLLAYGALVSLMVWSAFFRESSSFLAKIALLSLAIVGWRLVKSVSTRLTPPTGLEVTAANAEGLIHSVRHVGKTIGAPSLDRVRLDRTLNARVAAFPRFGVLPWYRHQLTIGLPFLFALDTKEAEALIAHELGHISKKHTQFGVRLFRTWATWTQLEEQLKPADDWILEPLRRFATWYIPILDGLTLAHRRQEEFEADRIAVEATSAEITGRMLLKRALAQRRLDTVFWPEVLRETRRRPEPPEDIYAQMASFIATDPAEHEALKYLDDVVVETTAEDSYHPSLSDRLAAIGVEASLPTRGGISAAEAFFGESLEHVCKELSQTWRDAVMDDWRQRFAQSAIEQTRFATLTEDEKTRPLNASELAEIAQLTEILGEPESALQRFQAWHQAQPDNADAQLGLGRVLLGRDWNAGLKLLLCAMSQDPSAFPAACGAIADRFDTLGQRTEANRWRRFSEAASREIALTLDERTHQPKDEYDQHGLAPETIETIGRHLAGLRYVRRAWIARKRVKHLPDWLPYFVVVVDIPWAQRWPRGKLQQIADRFPMPDAGGVTILHRRRFRHTRNIRRIPKIEGSLIYSRDQGSSSVSQ